MVKVLRHHWDRLDKMPTVHFFTLTTVYIPRPHYRCVNSNNVTMATSHAKLLAAWRPICVHTELHNHWLSRVASSSLESHGLHESWNGTHADSSAWGPHCSSIQRSTSYINTLHSCSSPNPEILRCGRGSQLANESWLSVEVLRFLLLLEFNLLI